MGITMGIRETITIQTIPFPGISAVGIAMGISIFPKTALIPFAIRAFPGESVKVWFGFPVIGVMATMDATSGFQAPGYGRKSRGSSIIRDVDGNLLKN